MSGELRRPPADITLHLVIHRMHRMSGMDRIACGFILSIPEILSIPLIRKPPIWAEPPG